MCTLNNHYEITIVSMIPVSQSSERKRAKKWVIIKIS